MPIAYGGSLGHQGSDGTEATTLALTTSGTVTAGGTVFLLVTGYNTGMTATVAGGGLTWTTDAASNSHVDGGYKAMVASAYAASGLASGSTLTVTYSNPGTTGAFFRTVTGMWATGLLTSSFFDVSGTAPSGGGTWDSGAQTTTNADDILVGGAYVDFANTTSTPGTNILEADDWNAAVGASATVTMVYRIVSATGSYSLSGTWASGTTTHNAVMAAYKGEAGWPPSGSGDSQQKIRVVRPGYRFR